MAARWFAFVIWAAVAASVVAWGLQLASSPQPVPAHTVPVADSGARRGDLLQLLGREAAPVRAAAAAPTATSQSSRFRLLGVVAPRGDPESEAGLALIAVDGKPARPVRVGGNVEEGLLLLGVHRRGASLGPQEGAPTVTLELPERPPPSTGTLAPALAPAPTPMPALPGVAVPPAVPIAPQAESIEPPQRAPVLPSAPQAVPPQAAPPQVAPQEPASAPEQ
jgi:general secretion pathway protein C